MKKWVLGGLLLIILVFASASVSAAGANTHGARVIQVQFHAVNNSGVSGFALLRQLPNKSGTHINVLAFGLTPGDSYVSLYYGNHVCDLEPYSASDVIGGFYSPNRVGVGVTQGNADDNLDEINSVSVRTSDFTLLACANVHP